MFPKMTRITVSVGAVWLGASLLLVPQTSLAVPSFARQTNMQCVSCHTSFPALTAFGRQFKLNGYVTNAGEVIAGKQAGKEEDLLALGKLPPVSVMMLASWTSTHTIQPGAERNGDVLLPDQFSFFLAGQIAPEVGAFMQVTYSAPDDHFGWDNTDIRAASHGSLAGRDLLYGMTLNNNPTVQDVWNSTPAWGYPFASSEAAPGPAAVTLIDGELAQRVAGVTVYSLWDNLVYAEAGAYRAAPIGEPRPLSGTTSGDVASQTVPFWRLAVQEQWGSHYLMLGAYGLTADLLPGNGNALVGETNRFEDAAMDVQYERTFGEGMLTAHSTWIHERQERQADYAAGAASNPVDELNVFRIDGNYLIDHRYGATLGYFATTGTGDSLLYPDSATASPDSRGAIAELDYLPWENTKFALQYTAYDKFDGAGSNYDGTGRNARDNDSLFAYAWLVF